MADLTEEQKKQIAEAVKAAQSTLKANNTVQVIVHGSGLITADNPRFRIEKRVD
ncbi:MAG: hypothetical protein Q8O55_07575 [Dehalococcoidales bacterium]|nr:hypothetical protein [Dehalococcoidales bacterium]